MARRHNYAVSDVKAQLDGDFKIWVWDNTSGFSSASDGALDTIQKKLADAALKAS